MAGAHGDGGHDDGWAAGEGVDGRAEVTAAASAPLVAHGFPSEPPPQWRSGGRPEGSLEPPPVSLQRWEALDDGSGEIVAELAALFLADTDAQLARLRRAASEGDGASLAEAAHSLRGSSDNLGTLELSRLCLRLEELAADGRIAEAARLLEPLAAQLERVSAALRRRLSPV